jgi:hypothetical protein
MSGPMDGDKKKRPPEWSSAGRRKEDSNEEAEYGNGSRLTCTTDR